MSMKVMRYAAGLLGLCFMQAMCLGDTAYQALRIASANNQDLLNHVIQVEGTKGETQPPVWRILLDDQSARGGVREMEVSKGRIISEHTPMKGYAGTGANSVMDFKRLNLDSQGAFTIANQEASKRHVSFDSVDYLLKSDEQSGAPVWILKLIDADHMLVGTLYVAADNGAVLRVDGFAGGKSGRTTSAYVPPPDTAAGTPAPVVTTTGDDNNGDIPKEQQAGYKINRGFHRIGGALQQFFTGKRTVDKQYDEPTPQQPPQ